MYWNLEALYGQLKSNAWKPSVNFFTSDADA